MKLQIKVKRHNNVPLPHFIEQGDWVDLTAAEDCKINRKSGYTSFSLGVSMELPEGYEAILAPRSSTPKKFGFLVPNSFGIIDNSYCGDNDIWRMTAYCIRQGGTTIKYGDRVAQFRIQLSQRATLWQKLKWLFTSKIEFVEVDHLEGLDRGGFGTTGHK